MPWMVCRTLCVGMVKQRGSVLGFPPSPPGQAQGERSPECQGVFFFSTYFIPRFIHSKKQQEIEARERRSPIIQRSSKGKEGKHQNQQCSSGGQNQQGVSGGQVLEKEKIGIGISNALVVARISPA